MRNLARLGVFVALSVAFGAAAPARADFVAFESGPVRPLALSPDGARLFAVNTPDNRLEIFTVAVDGSLTRESSVPVGLEPVAVAARSDSEVWVVNHLSDSVSVIDVAASPPRVVRTLLVGDEPRDVVFAGPQTGGVFQRAFITTARRGQNLPGGTPADLTTEGTPRALVFVFDAENLGTTLTGTPIRIIPLFGDTPRALAATPDGATVYAAVFHSGNQTTAISEGLVCDGGGSTPCPGDGITMPGGLAGGQMPGGLPEPRRNVQNQLGPEVGLILKYDRVADRWEDELGRNWNNAVRFSLPDLDVFEIDADAGTPAETDSFPHVGTVLFNMIVNPANGRLYVSNTDARNEVRFEGPGEEASTVRGRLHEARITVIDPVAETVTPRHLNKHIDALPQAYRTEPMPAGVKDDSLATPLGMAIAADGTLYVAAFGSSKIGRFPAAALENGTFTPDAATHLEVTGGGPGGLVLDADGGRLYVLTRFDNAVKVLDTTSGDELAAHPLHNPEPPEVVDGRRFLYDARFTSSNGEASCSSCHVFADFDSLGWDLGNPDDAVVASTNPIGVIGSQQAFHPMKGPMTTQTLRGMAHHGPMHWRGDRTGGGAQALNEQRAFEEFILEVELPPNPIRALDNSLTAAQQSARNTYFNKISDTVATCNGCHVLDPAQGFFGTNGETTFENETQEFKIAHLSNAYQKVGMFGIPEIQFLDVPDAHQQDQGNQVRGFGYLHDGSIPTVLDFLNATVFNLTSTEISNLEQFVFAFDTALAPIVGQQVTLTAANGGVGGVTGRLDLMRQRADTSFVWADHPGVRECDLAVKGNVGGIARGYLFDPDTNLYRSDRAEEASLSDAALRALAQTAGQELTFTCVPPGSGTRIALDRDDDTYLDRDELDFGSDPEDESSIPVPEPAQALLLAVGALALFRARRGRR
jgi:YVTN family beta-propeller protein